MLRRNRTRKRSLAHSFLLVVPATAFCLHSGNPATPESRNFSGPPLWHDTTTASADSAAARHEATITLNRHVTGFVKSYLKREAEFLVKMKGRSRRYFHNIETVFRKYDLPPQLKYLAIVESGLDPKATSAAGARGLWQLMPVTATDLGLKVSRKADERLQTYRSTVAAAKYLRSLYAQFGDWLLAVAAYNSGPGVVYAAIKKAGTRNYWALQRYLPAESRGHVKRFIGVHYYFEGQGSIVTQTKAEAKAWQEQWCVAER